MVDKLKVNILGPAPDRCKLKSIGKRLYKLLKSADPANSSLAMIVAYAHETFCQHLGDSLEKFVEAGGDVEAVVGVDSRGTSKIALRWLLDLLGFEKLHVYHNPGDGTFHPKIFIFKEANTAHVFIGSSNLTGGGLSRNFEINVEIELTYENAVERSYIHAFDKIFKKTKKCPSCLRLDAKTLEKIDDTGALRRGSTKKVETIFTEEVRTALSDIFRETKHSGSKPRVRRTKRKKRSFIMSLVRNDVSGRRGDPYFLIPILARNQNPEFWGWPARFHPTKVKGVPERHFNTKVKIGKNQRTEKGRLSFYHGVDEFRFKSKSVYTLGVSYIGSFVIISWSKDKWGLSVANLQLITSGTRKHRQLSKLRFQQVGPLNKRFRYIYS